ncbi:CRISPR associated protein Cas1 [Roseivivax lentus]|uniref:CRISPR associated protein Cas1 n=2 Tax=Roseivivax lentus TaxID=633194 RepID=A0A1N7Q748_9RHOB|nr:CRISPR associated protein Cas1 [Roseivivax lentus]
MVWLSYSGKLMGRVEGPHSRKALIGRAQHRALANSEAALLVAQAIALAKIASQRSILRHDVRDQPPRSV